MADVGPAHRQPRRRSTRSGPRWRSSTPRCSRSSRGCTGRSTRALDPPTGRAARRRPSDTGRTGTRPPRVGPFLRLGQLDRRRPRRQPGRHRRDHRADAAHPRRPRPARLRGGRDPADADRSPRATSAEPVSPRALASRLARDAEDLPETDRQLRRRFPDEPYRQRFGFIAERLRRTRAALTGEPAPLTGRYATPAELDAELAELQDALRRGRPRARRLGRGGGPALAARARSGSTSRRSRSASTRRSTRAALAAIRGGARRAPRERRAGRDARRGPRHVPGDRRGPGAVRRRGLPPLRRQLHARRRRT